MALRQGNLGWNNRRNRRKIYSYQREQERQERLEREQQEREQQILEEESRERERERQAQLEYQRSQEEQLRNERQKRLEEEQRRETERRRQREEEQRRLEEQIRSEKEIQMENERRKAKEQRLAEQQKREIEARNVEIRKRQKELTARMRQLELENKRRIYPHKNQTLYDWWKKGKITDEERKKLSEFNLNGKYTLKQLKEALEEYNCINTSPIIDNNATNTTDFQTIIRENLSNSLKRVRPKLAVLVAGGYQPEPSTEIIPFSTWFNADCATIVSKLNWTRLFDVWFSVRENPVKKIEGFVDIIWVSQHSTKDEARNKAAIVRKEMNEDCPALCIAPSLQVFYNNSDYLFVNIIKAYMPVNGSPDDYLLPLDIIERSSSGSVGSGGSYRHAAIYLGQDPKEPDKKKKHKVCHIFAPRPSRKQYASISISTTAGTTVGGISGGGATLSSASASEKKKAKARIDNWETFLTGKTKELIRYRITIPFKRYEKEIEQIAKAVITEFGKGNYHAVDRNCEHFAFAITCGVNFSEQEQVNRDKWYRKFLYRRGSKIEKMDLEREIKRNDEVFDSLVSGNIEQKTVSNEAVVKKYEEIEELTKDRSLYENLQKANVEVRVIIPPKYHNWK